MLATYRTLLGRPHMARLAATSTVARLPMGFEALAVVLLVRAESGSFAVAGLTAGALALGAGAAAPALGRLMDRVGQPRVLAPCAALTALMLILLVLAATGGAPAPVLLAVAALAGAVHPPVSSGVRALWPEVVPGSSVEAAYSFEAILQELVFIGGPLIAAAVAGLVSPAAAVLVAAGLWLGGTLAYVAVPPVRARRPRVAVRGIGAIGVAGLRTLVAAGVVLAGTFGALEVAMAAFARERGAPAAVGLLLACLAAASVAGGLWHGARAWRMGPEPRLLVFAGLFALGLVPLALAPTLGAMAALMAVAGLAVAPLMANLYTLAGQLAPPGGRAEAFSWLAAGFVLGGSVGASASGVVVEAAGARTALACVACVAGVLPAIVLARRAGLRPVVTGPPDPAPARPR